MASRQVFFGEGTVHDAVDFHHFVTQVLPHPSDDSAAVAVNLHANFMGVVFDKRHLLRLDESLVQDKAFEHFLQVFRRGLLANVMWYNSRSDTLNWLSLFASSPSLVNKMSPVLSFSMRSTGKMRSCRLS